MPPVRPEQVMVKTLPDPEQAPVHEYPVTTDPPVAFGDHVQVSRPDAGLVGVLTVGGSGSEKVAIVADTHRLKSNPVCPEILLESPPNSTTELLLDPLGPSFHPQNESRGL